MQKTVSLWKFSSTLSDSKNGGSVTILLNLLIFTSYCMHLIPGNVSIFKSVPFPVAGSVTLTAWVWNVSIYIADPK